MTEASGSLNLFAQAVDVEMVGAGQPPEFLPGGDS